MFEKNRHWSFSQWKARLKLRWAMRGTPQQLGNSQLPGTEQHREETDADVFKRTHGYSAATDPLPWGQDITAHNTAVQVEYAAEVERRKALYALGRYEPRFFVPILVNEETGEATFSAEVNWDLEMSLRPMARVDVTKETGVPMQPILTEVEYAEARLAGNLSREVKALEGGAQLTPKTPRQFIGSRAAILEAVKGNEAMADQVEANARKMFGVEDLDAPLAESKA